MKINRIYSKQIGEDLRKEIFRLGFFGDMPEITGTIPEGKRDYYKRAGRDMTEAGVDKEDVTLGDVLDWMRENGKYVSVDPFRDEDEIKYCGKVIDLDTGLGQVGYASEFFETALVSTIFDVLKEWK